MKRRVVITGLGPVSGLGLGIDANWQGLAEGRSAIARIQGFDPSGFECQIAAEVGEYSIRDYVPKTYRKATKVMARDIELAVIAADLAARDAKLTTKGTDPDAEPSYAPERMGCHIGAGLIAADVDELTAAFAEARVGEESGDGTSGSEIPGGDFDMTRWGEHGMHQLTPLWLLKYLPNMLACHVTIIHDSQGPSNTITCAEASSGLSLGESLRCIQRDMADLCFCGGASSKLNPMAFLRQRLADRLNLKSNDAPAEAVRPLDQQAAGTVLGEGGGLVVLEALDTAQQRGATPYAEVIGFGAGQTVNRAAKNRVPDAAGRGIAVAIKAALKDAGLAPDQVDLVVPSGQGSPEWDAAEVAALRSVLDDRLSQIPVLSVKAGVGNCAEGAGAIDIAVAARAVRDQAVPAITNRDQPLDGIAGSSPARETPINHALVLSVGFGGQNTAVVLKRL